ncbi:MAG: ATP-binding protein [Candidatus Kapaibacteriales bacterium]
MKMPKAVIFFLLLIFSSIYSFAEKNEEKLIYENLNAVSSSTELTESQKAEYFLEIYNYAKEADLAFADSILELSIASTLKGKNFRLLHNITSNYQNRPQDLYNFILGNTNYSKRDKLTYLIESGYGFFQSGRFFVAEDYFRESIRLVRNTNHQNLLAVSTYHLGNTLVELGKYEEASKYLTVAYSIFSKSNGEYAAKVYNSLATIYIRTGNHTEAKSHVEKGLALLGDRKGLTYAYLRSNLAEAYLLQGNFKRANAIQRETLNLLIEMEQTPYVAVAKNNVGEAYIQMEEYQEALGYLKSALKLNEELGEQEQIAYNLLNISRAYHKLGYTKESKLYLERAEEKIQTNPNFSHIKLDLSSRLSKMHNELGNFKEAYQYQLMHASIRDSLFHSGRDHGISLAMDQYEEIERQKQMYAMELEQLETENAVSRRETYLVIAGALGIKLILVLLWMWRNYKRKQELNSELNHKNAELEEAKNRTELALKTEKELSEVRSKFISIVSHELKNPLSVIMVTSEVLEAKLTKLFDDTTNEQMERYFKTIKSSIFSLSDILDEVLFISRTEYNSMDFEPEKIEMVSYLNTNVIKYEIVNDKDVDLTFTCDSDEINIDFDRRYLEKIVSNLMSNAIKYTPERGRIDVDIRDTEDSTILTIADSGIGIPEKEQRFLFEPFHRFSNVGNIKGNGLGLYIVKKSVELGGATIDVQSKSGEGTKFTIEFPKPIGVKSRKKLLSS